tara:strand:+ start:549 stop:797 length:249 start_codon:yes stop_codon:yes gene_type:complete
MKAKPSRTLESAKLAMIALLVLSGELLLTLIIAPDSIEPMAEVIGTLSLAISVVGTGGTVALGGRHWGAKEGSSFKHQKEEQ